MYFLIKIIQRVQFVPLIYLISYNIILYYNLIIIFQYITVTLRNFMLIFPLLLYFFIYAFRSLYNIISHTVINIK